MGPGHNSGSGGLRIEDSSQRSPSQLESPSPIPSSLRVPCRNAGIRHGGCSESTELLETRTTCAVAKKSQISRKNMSRCRCRVLRQRHIGRKYVAKKSQIRRNNLYRCRKEVANTSQTSAALGRKDVANPPQIGRNSEAGTTRSCGTAVGACAAHPEPALTAAGCGRRGCGTVLRLLCDAPQVLD